MTTKTLTARVPAALHDRVTALATEPGDDHRAGWDLTFSAPKSVAALVDESLREKIEKAHQNAVDVALDHGASVIPKAC